MSVAYHQEMEMVHHQPPTCGMNFESQPSRFVQLVLSLRPRQTEFIISID